jgi:hypothetical protein
MIGWSRIIPALIVFVAATVNVRADMVSVGKSRTDIHEPVYVVGQASLPSANSLDRVLDLASEADFGSLPVGYASGLEAGQSFGTQPVRLITDGRSSLSLFLYGLMSLGVFRSTLSIRKLSLGLISDWYHDGGPFQIGHSLAIGPDLHFAPVYCFIQPDCGAEDCLPKYYQGTIASLWRKSRLIPTVLASRGPPSLAN